MCALEEKKENGTNGSEAKPAVEKTVSMTSTELGRQKLDIQYLTDQVKSLERRNSDLEKQHLIMQCFHANEGLYNKYMVFKHSIDGADWQQLWNDKYSEMQLHAQEKNILGNDLHHADKDLLDLYATIEDYFECYELSSVKVLNDIFNFYIHEMVDSTQLKNVRREIDHVLEINNLISKLNMTYNSIVRSRKNNAADRAESLFQRIKADTEQ